MATKAKRKPRKAAKKSRTVARPRAMAPAGGPVTLAEAQAMVQAQRPPQAMRQVSKAAAPPASPASVGAERKKLEKQRKDEIAQRVRDYKATMAIMKKRGARRPSPKGAPKGVEPAAAPSFAPLQVLAEGDSWFDYPVPFFGGGIIPRLERKLGVPILNLAKAGDEVRYMLGVEERELITRAPQGRLSGRRFVGRVAVFRRRQRHRRQPDGVVDPGLRSGASASRPYQQAPLRCGPGAGARGL